MAVTINTIDAGIFTLNGVEHSRIFLPLAIGANNIGIYQVYDTRLQLVGATGYAEFIVDGAGAPASQAAALALLNPVLFSNPALAAVSLALDSIDTPVVTVGTGSFVTSIATMGTGLNQIENDGEIVEVAYGGLFDSTTGSRVIKLFGFGIELLTFNVSGWSGTGAWFIKVHIQRINQTTYSWIGEGTAVGNNYYTFQGRSTIGSWLSNNTFELSYLNQASDELTVNAGWIKKI
jgi:hypothetical protein